MQASFPARVFTAHDQERFAAFSGDHNPMHMDEAAARRTQAGTCAVHGVHAVLWALEQLAAAGCPLDRLTSARVDFSRFLRLGAPVSLDLGSSSPQALRAELAQDERQAVRIDLGFADPPAGPGEVPARMPGGGALPPTPAEPDLEELRQARGTIDPPTGAEALAAELFPRTAAALGAGRTVSLGLLSALVGMVAPGLHSIFSAIRIGFREPLGTPRLGYAVASLDDRFRMLRIDVAGRGFAGWVGAFVRFPPVRPPALPELEQKVAPGEFAERCALVIGGSRGLGACTAKLIAAGGGSVVLTYLNGRAEAEEIRDEISARYGAERCAIARYDVGADPAAQLPLPGRFSHAYYFATGRIADQGDAVFDRGRLDGFLSVYVDGFSRMARLLLARAPEAGLHLFYPSSVFVEARPRGMAEYAMAKAAGEILCAELMRDHRTLAIVAPRLPRVLTDQTATVPPVPVADPVEVLLPLLRAEASGH